MEDKAAASLTSSLSYAPDLMPTGATGANGETTSTVYDSYARPSYTVSKTGAVTTYAYVTSPPQTLSYTNPSGGSLGRVTRLTLDGFGRTIKAESGTGTTSGGGITLSTVLSVVDSVYAPCGCSPLGKLSKTSRPYAPGGSVYWTVYNYDGIGRTASVVAPDGLSTSSYIYSGTSSGPTVKTTDGAAKWKLFTTDAAGTLTQVNEPNPAGGADYLTNYTYDILGQLRSVLMPRGSTTQTRTFGFSGTLLTSAANPENGTVTNYYNGDRTFNYQVDAKGQAIVYTYNSSKRVTQVSKYPGGYTPGGTNSEDACQRVNYYYDTNPDTTNYLYTQYTLGRLTSIHYAGAQCSTFNGTAPTSTTGNNYIEMYAYSQAGKVTRKTMRLWKKMYPGTYSPSADLEAVYTYDSEGKMLSQSYPLGTNYSYTYDAMGRPTKMTDTGTSTDLVSTVSYGPAGELISMSGSSVSESRTYNSMGQLTQLTGLSGVNIKYTYPAAGANNGQIASQQDLVSGETISYVYDSLKRLSSAASTAGWGQSFGYDGFGNLTSKSALSGTPPVGTYSADPTTNRLSSSTGATYDANGNQTWYTGSSTGLTYDVSNRMISSSSLSLAGLNEYDPSNRRVYQQKQHFNGSIWVIDATEFYFYGVTGQKLGMYWATVSGSGGSAAISWTPISTQVFFRRKLIQRNASNVQTDRRGSIGSFYPYGEDRSVTANDAVKFASYVRDSVSGLDYAVNRYHLPGMGRFLTPDRSRRSAKRANPPTWNRYPYVAGDPINRTDRRGLDTDLCDDDGGCCPDDDSAECKDPGGDTGPGGYPGEIVDPGEPGAPGSDFQWCDDPGSSDTHCEFQSSLVDQEAAKALGALDPKCQNKFSNTLVPSAPGAQGPEATVAQALSAVSGNTTFIDVRSQGNMTINQVTGLTVAGSDATISQYLAGSQGAMTLTVDLGFGSGLRSVNFVILSASFFTQSAATQDTLLIHEMLHEVLQDHQDIQQALGFQDPTDKSNQGWSNAIANYLNGGCQ